MWSLLGLSPFKIAGILVALAVLAGVVFYVKHNENVKEQLLTENAQLQASISVYKDANATLNDTVDFLEAQSKKRAEEFLKTESRFAEINDQNQSLLDRIAEIETAVKAAENPAAVAVIINDISRNLNRCFELASGASLTDKEKNAKNENEFNPECPWLYADLVRN